MDEIATRLVKCFQTVFPSIPESRVRDASQASVEAWDSVATVTLLYVIEDEFGVKVALDRLGELDSFNRIHEYLREATQTS
jgi:acyl carrier protein